MKHVLSVLLALSVYSCTHKMNVINDIKNPESKSQQLTNESFEQFFLTLMLDENFQKSRVKFPIEINGKHIQTAESWQHMPFYRGFQYIPFILTDTVNLFEIADKNSKIEFSMIELEEKRNISYKFQVNNKQWFLVSIRDQSIEDALEHEFINFLIKFSKDSVFQTNHINFPVSETYLDMEDDFDDIITRNISMQDWQHLTILEEDHPLMILPSNTSGTEYRYVKFEGLECGIWVLFTFLKKDNEWELISWEDYST